MNLTWDGIKELIYIFKKRHVTPKCTRSAYILGIMVILCLIPIIE